MSPLAAGILVVLMGLILCGSRRLALASLFAGALFLTQGATLEIGGFSLHAIRILVLTCFARCLARSEIRTRLPSPIDSALLVLYLYTAAIFLLRTADDHAVMIAKTADVTLAYLCTRGLVRDTEDLKAFLKIAMLMFVPYVMLLAFESRTGANPFGIVGATKGGWMRGDKVRCFASFRHPSLLGSLGATFFPVFVAYIGLRHCRRWAIAGALLSTFIVIASSSGGPLSAFASAIVAWAFWPMRNRMKAVRRVALVAIICLAVVMKAPIWYLIARISSVTGGTGFHRSYLIDVSMKHLSDWWLMGMPIRETATWFPYVVPGTGGADITNQFIAFGIAAGIPALLLSIRLLVIAFQQVGMAIQSIHPNAFNAQESRLVLWGFGSMVFVHMMNWLGITYFDQFSVIWMIQLGSLASVTQQYLHSPPDPDDGTLAG